jgi:hypothetical protein
MPRGIVTKKKVLKNDVKNVLTKGEWFDTYHTFDMTIHTLLQ